MAKEKGWLTSTGWIVLTSVMEMDISPGPAIHSSLSQASLPSVFHFIFFPGL